MPVLVHTAFTIMVVAIDLHSPQKLGVPSTIVPSLSIVVGLMLVFRNSSSYERYWGGRQHLQCMGTAIRNLARSFLVCGPDENEEDRYETEKVIKILIGIMYAVKNHLRGIWCIGGLLPEYKEFLPVGLYGNECDGLALALQLSVFIERYIKRGVDKGAFNAPQSSMLSSQVNTLIDAYGKMETIK